MDIWSVKQIQIQIVPVHYKPTTKHPSQIYQISSHRPLESETDLLMTISFTSFHSVPQTTQPGALSHFTRKTNLHLFISNPHTQDSIYSHGFAIKVYCSQRFASRKLPFRFLLEPYCFSFQNFPPTGHVRSRLIIFIGRLVQVSFDSSDQPNRLTTRL